METQYTFQHALQRETLYQRVARGRRRRLHQAIGTRLEAGYGKRAKEVAAELALHFEQGGEIDKAVGYCAAAGVTALQRGAHQEIMFQATKGLNLLETLPPSPKNPTRLTHELQLQTLRAQGFMATKSHTAEEVEQSLLRARDLCKQAGDIPQQLVLLLGLFHLYQGRSTLEPARELAEACLALATQQDYPPFFVGAHYAMGVNALFRGQLAEAQPYLDQVGVGYESEQHKSMVRLYGFNPVVISRLFGAMALVLRGYPDQAAQQIEQTLGLEHEMTSSFTNVYAHCVAPLGLQYLRDAPATTTQADAGVTLGMQRGFPAWIAFGTVLRGWGQFAQGAVTAGIAEMHAGLAAMHELGAKSSLPHYLTMLAEAVGTTGDCAQALQHVDEALAAAERGGERAYESEAWRVKGEILVQSSMSNVQSSSEGCFQKALEVAHQQDAKLLELRAATSLSRLWQQQGKTGEARELLAPVYEWFTEGFDTPDLQEAKALLATLR